MNGVATQPYPLMAGRTRAENPDKTRNLWATYGPIAFCLVHVPLALLVYRVNTLSTLHAVAVFAVGMWWALTAPHQPLRVAYVAAYITGAEVLWRMTHSPGVLGVWQVFNRRHIPGSHPAQRPVKGSGTDVRLLCLVGPVDRSPHDANGYLRGAEVYQRQSIWPPGDDGGGVVFLAA